MQEALPIAYENCIRQAMADVLATGSAFWYYPTEEPVNKLSIQEALIIGTQLAPPNALAKEASEVIDAEARRIRERSEREAAEAKARGDHKRIAAVQFGWDAPHFAWELKTTFANGDTDVTYYTEERKHQGEAIVDAISRALTCYPPSDYGRARDGARYRSPGIQFA